MKYTVLFVTLLSITYTSAIKAKIEDPKDKRDASGDYAPSAHSPHSYQSQAQSLGQDEGNAISIGAGYSVGGGKPSYVYASQGQEAGSPYQLQAEGLASGHSIQLAPITLQPGQGLASNDLSDLMNQLSQGLNSGAISIPSGGHGGQGASYQLESQDAHGLQGYQGLQGLQGLQLQGLQSLQGLQGLHGLQAAQGPQGGQYSLPQYTMSSAKLAPYSLGGHGSLPVYASNTKGLGSFGSTGPVLFTPQSYSAQSAPSHGAPSAQSYESAAYSLGEKGHPGFSLGGSSHSLGASYKAIAAPSNYAGPGNYAVGGKGSFKPSTFIGASIPSESAHSQHSQAGHSASYNVPSFASFHSQSGGPGLRGLALASAGSGNSFGGHGAPSKHMLISSEGLGSLESIASAFSQSGQIASPPRTTYGFPSGSYSSGDAHSAPAHPQYYISSKYPSSSGFSGGASYKGAGPSHSSLSSYSSAPKYSHGGHSSHYSPKDAQGAYSETSYNTIKYSEELKPRGH